MEKLLAALGAQSSGAQDDNQFITNKIEQMMTEKYKSEELMQEHQTLLNGLFLSTVLRGGLHSENAIFAAAKRYEVSFEHPTYQVLVLAGTERSVPDAGPEPGLLHGTLAELGHEGLVSAYGGPLRGAAERGGMPARQPGRGPCPRAAGPGLSRRPATRASAPATTA